MQKPISLALIVTIVVLFVVHSINLFDAPLQVWQIVSTIFLLGAVCVYAWDRFCYARDQKDVFAKDYIIGIFIIIGLSLVYACNNQQFFEVVRCYGYRAHHCSLMLESTMLHILFLHIIVLFVIYTIIFVLQLPEKKC